MLSGTDEVSASLSLTVAGQVIAGRRVSRSPLAIAAALCFTLRRRLGCRGSERTRSPCRYTSGTPTAFDAKQHNILSSL